METISFNSQNNVVGAAEYMTHRPMIRQKVPTNVLVANDISENSTRQYISIEDFYIYEERQPINSPKSLYACRLEGIFPKELLYKPLQKYQDRNKQLPKEVIKLRFDFFENKRLEMINTVKRARQKIIEELRQNGGSKSRSGTLSGERVSLSKAFSQSHIDAAIAPLQPKIFGNAGFNMKLGGLATARNQGDASQLTGGSRMGHSASIDHAVQRDRELFQKQMELCERTRQKEAKMVEKIIRNEELKNLKIEENQRKFEELTMREQIKNNSIQRKLKEDQEKKHKMEMEKTKMLEEIEKKEKQYQWKSFIKRLEKQRQEEQVAEYKIQIRKELMQERDKLRQEKFLICQERNEEIMDMNRSRIMFVQEKHEKMLRNLEEKKRMFQLTAREKKQEKEQFKQKVFENIQKQEEEKEKGWYLKQIQEKEKEMRFKREKDKQIKEQIMRAQSQDRKIQETLMLSERKDNQRKEHLLQKQHEASMRLERQRSKQRFQEQLKKEMFNLKNMSKDYNRQRASRKHEFKNEQLLQKIDQDQSRYSALVEERTYLKDVRIKTLIESEIQRENIKNALFQMSVWNTFDPKIIFHIMGQERQYEGQGIGGGDSTIEELVRKTAVSQQRQRKINRHQFSSSLGFQSMGGMTQPSTSVPLTERGNNFKIANDTNLFGFVSPAKTQFNHENQSAEDISLVGVSDTPRLFSKGQNEREQASLRNQSSEQIDHLQGSTFMRHSLANSTVEQDKTDFEKQQNSEQNQQHPDLDDSHSGLTYDVKIPRNKKKKQQTQDMQMLRQEQELIMQQEANQLQEQSAVEQSSQVQQSQDMIQTQDLRPQADSQELQKIDDVEDQDIYKGLDNLAPTEDQLGKD